MDLFPDFFLRIFYRYRWCFRRRRRRRRGGRRIRRRRHHRAGITFLRSPRQSTARSSRSGKLASFASPSFAHRHCHVEGLDERSAHLCFIYLLSLLEWQRKRREKQNNGTTKSRALLSPFLSLAESANAAKEERGKCFLSARGVSLERFSLSRGVCLFPKMCFRIIRSRER